MTLGTGEPEAQLGLDRVPSSGTPGTGRYGARIEPPKRSRLARIWSLAWRGLAGLGALILVLMLLYRLVDPPVSTLMIGNALLGRSIEQQWVPLEQISPNLIKAVIMSEDGRYCEHWGVDWTAMRAAWRKGRRGASTIPMQTVKNLFLWPGRSYVRKVIELPLAHVSGLVWGKRRTLELYLNVAEWGPGIYGAEAAARHHFKRSAADLTPYQAALLAASLPNPLKRKANAPNSQTKFHAAKVSRRMAGAEAYIACVLP